MKDLRTYASVYDLTGWTRPEGCPCHFVQDPARSRVYWTCPAHGLTAGPVAGPPDWPARLNVLLTDERGLAAT